MKTRHIFQECIWSGDSSPFLVPDIWTLLLCPRNPHLMCLGETMNAFSPSEGDLPNTVSQYSLGKFSWKCGLPQLDTLLTTATLSHTRTHTHRGTHAHTSTHRHTHAHTCPCTHTGSVRKRPAVMTVQGTSLQNDHGCLLFSFSFPGHTVFLRKNQSS